MKIEINKKQEKIIIISLIALIVFSLSFLTIKIAEAPSFFYENSKKEEKLTIKQELKPLPEASAREITLIFTGDIMLSRTVNAKMERYNDYNWPFLKIADFLNEADLVVGNLESPFLKDARSYEVLTGSFSFKANPLAIEGLKFANFGLFSLANNHTINQGQQGIIDTVDILKENGIKAVGAGLNEEEARRPAIITIEGYDFAFLAYAYPNDYSIASENRAGIANMDIEKMEKDIELLKTLENAPDFIVVLMHAGTEYVLEPNWQQKEFARSAISAGADMVVGHHPHWPQVFEFYEEKPIIYSLGNFVFDQMWSEETRQGLLLKMTWQNGIKALELIPTKIYDYGQVEVLEEGLESSNILKRIKAEDSGLIYEKL